MLEFLRSKNLPEPFETQFRMEQSLSTKIALRVVFAIGSILIIVVQFASKFIVVKEIETSDQWMIIIQSILVYGFASTYFKGKWRLWSVYLSVIPCLLSFVGYMVFMVGTVQPIQQVYAHGMVFIIIFSLYSFEKLNVWGGVIQGIGVSAIYLYFREKFGLNLEPVKIQVVMQLSFLNIVGMVICASNLKRERARFLAQKHLEAEQLESEILINRIFPRSISTRLRLGEKNIADRFAEVTVIFADLVGFTRMASQLSPDKTLSFLDGLFSLFDKCAEEAGVEKVKTIGDSYMAVSGAPVACIDHQNRAAHFALLIRDTTQKYVADYEFTLSIRIGMHSGSAIAGVIGEKRFGYDVWGDTVNIASRMESLADVGEILISSETAAELSAEYQLGIEKSYEVKGKGWISGRHLVGRTSEKQAA